MNGRAPPGGGRANGGRRAFKRFKRWASGSNQFHRSKLLAAKTVKRAQGGCSERWSSERRQTSVQATQAVGERQTRWTLVLGAKGLLDELVCSFNKVRVVIDASRKTVEVIRGTTKSFYPTSEQACAIKCKGFDIVSNFNRGTA